MVPNVQGYQQPAQSGGYLSILLSEAICLQSRLSVCVKNKALRSCIKSVSDGREW